MEGYPNLEVSIIKSTKINKVLKAIIKLQSIPSDEEYNFKKRALVLLDGWNQTLANDPEASGAEPSGKPNGKAKTTDSDEGALGEKESGKVEVSGVDEEKSGDEEKEEKSSEEKQAEEPVDEKAYEPTAEDEPAEEYEEKPADEKEVEAESTKEEPTADTMDVDDEAADAADAADEPASAEVEA